MARGRGKLLSLSPEVRSAFAFWQALRSLGFESDRLYAGVVGARLLLSIRPPGVSVAMGTTAMSPEDFESAWGRLCAELPSIPEHELKANYERYVTPERWQTLVATLLSNGVEVPAHRQRLN